MKPNKIRFYYDSTGHIFFEVNVYGETTVEKDISDFKVLSERNRDTFDVLELPYGAYEQDFAESDGYRVNVDTKELVFSYPDPENPEAPQVFEIALSTQLKSMEKRVKESENAIISLMELQMM